MSWVENSIFYNIYPLGFCGAPENNNGVTEYRLDKINEWLPHIKELGVTAIVFNPVFESIKHGYDTTDYYRIDCRLGDNQSFKKICKTLHDNGIRVLLDGVFNHVGRKFAFFTDVRINLQRSKYCGWFKNLNFNGNSPYNDRFAYEGWAGNYDLVKLNLQNSEVVDHLLGAVKMWMEEFEIDGLRLDAADCIDESFFRQLRQFCKSKKSDFWLYGEIIHGDYRRWANPEMLDSVTNYECYKGLYSSHNDHNYFEIAHSLERQFGREGMYKDLCTYNFVDNHDVNRIGSVVKNRKYLNNIHTLLYTMPGAPSIYYGSEWAVEGMRTDYSDSKLRPCLDIMNIENPDMGLHNHLVMLGKIRNNLSALQNGSFENVLIKNEQLVIKRKNAEQTVYIALNLSSCEQWVEFNAEGCGVLTDVLNSNAGFECSNYVKLPIPAFCSRIMVQNDGSFHIETDKKTDIAAQGITNEKSPDSSTAGNGHDNPGPYSSKNTKKDILEILPVRLGRYRHFKGNEYEVIGFAKHSETLEDMVVYRALYGERGLWVRPCCMFSEIVEKDGIRQLRFAPID